MLVLKQKMSLGVPSVVRMTKDEEKIKSTGMITAVPICPKRKI